MKKLFLFAATLFLFASCEYILKDRDDDEVEIKTQKRIVLGTDKDAKGCVISAGYRWSVLRNECIRVFEEGFRLNKIEELKGDTVAKSAFVIFEENGNRAELFLPDGTPAVILTRDTKDGPYKNKSWMLETAKNYTLKQNGVPQYAGALIEENKITGDDRQES